MSLFSNGLVDFTTHTGINFTIAALCYLGSIGFVVFADVWQLLRKKRKALTFTSQIILKGSLLLISSGSVLFFILEPAIQNLSTYDKVQVSLFHVISASSTAGFNSIDFGLLSIGNLFLLCILMMIGASPSGTGGGLKITVVGIVLAHMKSSFQGLNKTILQNIVVPPHRVRLALATFSFYAIILVTSILFLTYLHPSEDFEKILFEAVSAFSTVGLTMGLTYDLGSVAKIVLCVTMFVGRIGFLTLGLILFQNSIDRLSHESKDIAI
jgi:trk system potassium uptake protein TrkH